MIVSMQKIVSISLVLLSLVGTAGFAEVAGYGAKSLDSATGLTVEEMLNYAIQDEYLARAEYELIIQEYGNIRPFSRIILAEERHILWVIDALNEYEFAVPEDESKDHVVLPTSIKTALETGVKAEIDNIAMYDKFLAQPNLPATIRTLFLKLQNGSRNHLRAFQNRLRR